MGFNQQGGSPQQSMARLTRSVPEEVDSGDEARSATPMPPAATG